MMPGRFPLNSPKAIQEFFSLSNRTTQMVDKCH